MLIPLFRATTYPSLFIRSKVLELLSFACPPHPDNLPKGSMSSMMRPVTPMLISLLQVAPPARYDLASDTRPPPLSIEKHFVLPPTLYAAHTFPLFCTLQAFLIYTSYSCSSFLLSLPPSIPLRAMSMSHVACLSCAPLLTAPPHTSHLLVDRVVMLEESYYSSVIVLFPPCLCPSLSLFPQRHPEAGQHRLRRCCF